LPNTAKQLIKPTTGSAYQQIKRKLFYRRIVSYGTAYQRSLQTVKCSARKSDKILNTINQKR